MNRLLVHVEGQTEERFVNEVLAPHLASFGYASVVARLIGNARQRSRRGGIKGWPTVREEIVRHLREDAGARATLMVDYYALPCVGEKAWPGRAAAARLAPAERGSSVEVAIRKDLVAGMGSGFDPSRFIPYIAMHEFEGLLFSDCAAFGRAMGSSPDQTDRLAGIRAAFPSPEDIDDSPETAPSKRVEGIFPCYQKPLHGTRAAKEIGIDRIRQECPGFARWLGALESAGATTSS